ncbi:MAG TPA: SDR family NAD(P)-dependent oxidoreductase [Stellaceae bacterium]|nr:SDR family NAD(P)-dependent oxidoreductase [Stellaceae bacterium]
MKDISNGAAANKVALVTGASSGIGKAIAIHLGRHGYRVFGTSRHADTVAGIEMIAMDVDDEASVERGIATVLERAGRLDAVINNAGWAIMGAVEDTSIEEAKAQLETNFFGVLRVCRAVLPVMRRQRGGAIINISSLSGIFGTPFSGLYSASKFAVEGMTEALRFETRKLGLRVVLIEPGDHASALAAKRRVAKAASLNPAYREAFEKFKVNQEKDEAKAPPPEGVAKLVVRILAASNPRPRYVVGALGQRIVAPLKRFLPGKLFEAIVGSAIGV